jgi:hypothetical protein
VEQGLKERLVLLVEQGLKEMLAPAVLLVPLVEQGLKEPMDLLGH